MATRAQKVRLSIFLISAGGLLVIALLVLAGSRLFSHMDRYSIEYRDVSVSGLEAGAPVKLHGVQVGRVSDLSVKDAETVVLHVDVKRGTPIQRDTKAVLAMMGITGLKFVELVEGTREAGLLPPGGQIPSGRTMFDTISGRADEILGKAENLLNSLNRLLDPQTTQSIQRSLAGLAGISEQLDTMLVDNRASLTRSIARFDTVLTRLAETSAHVESTMEQVSLLAGSPELAASLDNIRRISDRFREQVDSLRIARTFDQLETLLENSNSMVVHSDLLIVESRSDVLRSLASLEESLENLREATDIIRDNPSVLIRGRQTEDRIE